jgi:hypothetical protein
MSYRTVEAAEALMTGTSRGSWSLADALVADVPGQPRGGDHAAKASRDDFATVRDQLVNITIALEEHGITTPNGDAYSVDSLRNLRATALAWPEKERHPEAAYRTHQEAGNSPQRRAVLDALARHANKEPVDNPDPSWIDDNAFDEACQMVETAVARGRGYAVPANAMRVAMQRKPNVNKPPSTVFEMLEKVNTIGTQLADFQSLMDTNGVGLADDEREALARGIDRLVQTLTSFRVQVLGVSDDDIQSMMERESDGRDV